MKKIIMMKGLPGSGKSTYAKKLLTDNPGMYKRINRDDLRAMFDNGQSSNDNEKFAKKVRDLLVLTALEAGKHVIVDDTNLSEKNETRMRQLAHEFNKANKDNVTVEVVEIDTPLTECIERDALREKPVGEKVIKQMHTNTKGRYGKYRGQDPALPKAIICDLDGTLALFSHRSPFDASTCELDELNLPVFNLISTYVERGFKLILLSGRKEVDRAPTERWLAKHGIGYEVLLMRGDDDNRKDAIIKKETFTNKIDGKYYIELVLDDRNQVVDMWRFELNLPCFQVNYGDF